MKAGTTTLKRLHIFNPAAGGGHSPDLLEKGAAANDESYITTGIGDAERFIYETCRTNPETHFIVYGGDGTLNEAANGIICADAGKKALLSVVPTGTGNDFIRSLPEKNKIKTVDAITYNGRYAVNIINFGFDSNVVVKTAAYKKIFPGSAAYIAGVVDTLCKKIGESWEIEIEDELGNSEKMDGEFTMALAANGQYYGGGFHSAPLADLSDGLLDFIAVKKVSRLTFIKLIGDYKKGIHLDPETRQPIESFRNFMVYRRCKKMKITGISNLCADGEIMPVNSLEIGIIQNALRIAT